MEGSKCTSRYGSEFRKVVIHWATSSPQSLPWISSPNTLKNHKTHQQVSWKAKGSTMLIIQWETTCFKVVARYSKQTVWSIMRWKSVSEFGTGIIPSAQFPYGDILEADGCGQMVSAGERMSHKIGFRCPELTVTSMTSNKPTCLPYFQAKKGSTPPFACDCNTETFAQKSTER